MRGGSWPDHVQLASYKLAALRYIFAARSREVGSAGLTAKSELTCCWSAMRLLAAAAPICWYERTDEADMGEEKVWPSRVLTWPAV